MYFHGTKAQTMQDLEEELGRDYYKIQNDTCKRLQMGRTRRELAVFRSVLDYNKTESKLHEDTKKATHIVLTNLGETSILDNRIGTMQDLLFRLNGYHDLLKNMIELYDDNVIYILNFIAKHVGYVHPSDVLGRFLTLDSLKIESLKEQDKLTSRYIKMHEKHRQIQTDIEKKNLQLSNQVHGLYRKLSTLETTVKEQSKVLQVLLDASSDSSRLVFAINNQINALHNRMTVERGYPTKATTIFQKLTEISDRTEILKKATQALKINYENEFSYYPTNENVNMENTTSHNVNVYDGKFVVKETILSPMSGTQRIKLSHIYEDSSYSLTTTCRPGTADDNSYFRMRDIHSTMFSSYSIKGQKISCQDGCLGTSSVSRHHLACLTQETNESSCHHINMSDKVGDCKKRNAIAVQKCDRPKSIRLKKTTGDLRKVPHLPKINSMTHNIPKGHHKLQSKYIKCPQILPSVISKSSMDSS